MATVLIVQDQEQILILAQSFLEEQGHKTLSASTADELKPRLKVVYSTGLSVTDGMKALFVPGSDVLEKPYTVDQLLTSLSVRLLPVLPSSEC